MSDETSSLTKPIQDLVEAIGVGLWIIGTAIFVAFGVPLIGFLGIQFVQMGGNWWWAGMFLFGVGVLILFLSWIFILGIFRVDIEARSSTDRRSSIVDLTERQKSQSSPKPEPCPRTLVEHLRLSPSLWNESHKPINRSSFDSNPMSVKPEEAV